MAGITLHSENDKSVTCVPNVFIDELMADADGEFVKIYLYLLRCMNGSSESCSISGMADKFEHTEKDIKRALAYWEKAHLLRLEYDDNKKLTGICLSDTSSLISSAPGEKQAPKPAAAKEPEKKADYSLDEMQAFQQDKSVQELLFITETYLGHTLSATDINTILYWHDSLGFNMDLIEYLIEYCVGNGHKSMRYMEKVALSWHQTKISTVAEAKEMNANHSRTTTAVMKAFGISGRNLVDTELKFIEKWTGSYGFSIELVTEACKRTMQAIHQPSFEYTDSILNNWRKKNVAAIKDVAALDAAFSSQNSKTSRPVQRNASSVPNKFNNFTQRSYDFDQLEKKVLNSSMR